MGCDYGIHDNSFDCIDKEIKLENCYDSIVKKGGSTPVKIGLYDIHVVSESSELYIDAFVAYDASDLQIGNNFLLILKVNDLTNCTVVMGMKAKAPPVLDHQGRRMQEQEVFENHSTDFAHGGSGINTLNKFKGDYTAQDVANAKKSLPKYSMRKIRYYSFSDMRGLLFVAMNKKGLSDFDTQVYYYN